MICKKVLLLLIIFSFASCKKESFEKKDIISLHNISLDVPFYFGEPNIPSNNPLTKEGIELGRHLFYDKMLSLDSSVSCGSCHIQKFGFSDTTQFSEGVNNQHTKRKSMGLSNLAWQDTFFWDGRSNSLEDQVLFPLESAVEMNLNRVEAVHRLSNNSYYKAAFKEVFNTETITPSLLAKAIAQFERTLISGKSKYDLYKTGLVSLTSAELRGEKLFYIHPIPNFQLRGGNCGDCHSGLLTTNNEFSNNGLDSIFEQDTGLEQTTKILSDKGKFKIVSLRNVVLHPPFMHDGRFKTLEEVLDHYNEHIRISTTLDPLIKLGKNDESLNTLGLTAQEKLDIISFLKTLTDESFIKNEQFSDPFN